MLYDFHRKQTVEKEGSIHATYLLTGIQTAPIYTESNRSVEVIADDVPMPSGLLMSNSIPNRIVKISELRLNVITLATEEDLESKCIYICSSTSPCS
jgi:DNA polymerase delta subunit 3